MLKLFIMQQFSQYLSSSQCRFDLGPFADKGDRIGKYIWPIGSSLNQIGLLYVIKYVGNVKLYFVIDNTVLK